MRVLVQHQSRYRYPKPASLGPHLIRLRPAPHTKAHIETYGLTLSPDCNLRWQQDPVGNHVVRATYPAKAKVEEFVVKVEMAVEIRPLNPFDFFLDERCEHVPFDYPSDVSLDLAPFLALNDPSLVRGPLFDEFFKTLPSEGQIINVLVAINQAVNQKIRYVIREEPGVWTPEETLQQGRGSCRDSAMLLVGLLRSMGLATRFVSGFLIQLRDEGMLPDQPKGMDRDVVDLHAWAEVYVPGAGWIGLDATSGLLCGEGHIPLACTATPQTASAIDGTSDVLASDVSFAMSVVRLSDEARPTHPYSAEVWERLLESGAKIDAKLVELGIHLTVGGEPTFNSREHADAPEWNGDALGPTKWDQGLRLASELRPRFTPGGVLLHRMGKHYPGESLPRWALEMFGAKDGTQLWSDLNEPQNEKSTTRDQLTLFATTLAKHLGVESGLHDAFEDPWRFLQDEAALPVDVDPLKADLKSSEERRRLARVLDRGLNESVGYVLPLARASWFGQRSDTTWITDRWNFRRGHLFLLPGDSPMGLRLPLQSLSPGLPLPSPYESAVEPPDPRRVATEKALERAKKKEKQAAQTLPSEREIKDGYGVRTALCIEPRDGKLFVFLPPVLSWHEFLELVSAVDSTRKETNLDVILEGYPPPPSPLATKIAVTPDPGVLEVNVPPVSSVTEHQEMFAKVFDAALHSGLHCEKYLLDGRLSGSGGGNHITLGGPTTAQSPFLNRPDVLASLLTVFQHHPSLSYLFTGLFVGPTSQAPRVDEARHDSLYELEIALERAFQSGPDSKPPPWLVDSLFRHLLTDLSGNTHRTEICIDKLFDPVSHYGRQGLLEFRAFEMPPHPWMVTAQIALVRGLVAACAVEPYQGNLVRWGNLLHDRFLLPYWMWRDFEDVLDLLKSRGVGLEEEAYRAFVDLRCPLAGNMVAGNVTLEVRNAIEPWNVLGEEISASGTSRYVDSSMERVEILAKGLNPERHVILVNGHVLPMRPTHIASDYVAGVRFRAWAPPHSLHPHLGIHHPLHIDVLDRWAKRSLGACAYHVWHPEGRAFDKAPLTRFEAAARRSRRFTETAPRSYPVQPLAASAHPDAPYTLDLRRLPMDRPMPEPEEDEAGEG